MKMNRRNTIQALVATAALPLVKVPVAPAVLAPELIFTIISVTEYWYRDESGNIINGYQEIPIG